MTRVIRCQDAVERLWAYLDDDLDPRDHADVEQHLRFCLRCCGEVDFARQVRHLLATRSRPALPDSVQDRLERFIDDVGGPRTAGT